MTLGRRMVEWAGALRQAALGKNIKGAAACLKGPAAWALFWRSPMPRDGLEPVSKIRNTALDHAKQHLAASLAEEDQARQRADAAEALIHKEGRIAASLSTGDGAVEAYAAWLPGARSQAQAGRAAHEDAVAKVVLARASLKIAYAAAEAVVLLQERLKKEADLKQARKSQAEMDEVAARVTRAKAAST